MQQQIENRAETADNKNLNPILKRSKIESINEFDIPRKERQSKSVQIESDDQIYGKQQSFKIGVLVLAVKINFNIQSK